jgi:hypothetical protein
VPFVTPEDEAEEFDDSFYISTPPPPYLGQGPIPGDPRTYDVCLTRMKRKFPI